MSDHYTIRDDVHQSAKEIKHYFASCIVGYFPVKLVATGLAMYTSYVGVDVDVLVPTFALLLFDVASGVMRAVKQGNFCSSKLRKFTWKWFSYAMMVTVVGMMARVACTCPGIPPKVLAFVKAFPNGALGMIALTEGISTLENIRDAGYVNRRIVDTVLGVLRGVTDAVFNVFRGMTRPAIGGSGDSDPKK